MEGELEAAAEDEARQVRLADASTLREPVVKVSAALHGRRIRVVVEDNGPGLPPDQVHRLFEAYFSTKADSRGAGLGLAIVRETLTRFRGTITVESKLGEGTRFVIDLPEAALG